MLPWLLVKRILAVICFGSEVESSLLGFGMPTLRTRGDLYESVSSTHLHSTKYTMYILFTLLKRTNWLNEVGFDILLPIPMVKQYFKLFYTYDKIWYDKHLKNFTLNFLKKNSKNFFQNQNLFTNILLHLTYRNNLHSTKYCIHNVHIIIHLLNRKKLTEWRGVWYTPPNTYGHTIFQVVLCLW